jgi:hypothetical protein
MALQFQLAALQPTGKSNQSQQTGESPEDRYCLGSYDCYVDPGGDEEVEITDVRRVGVGAQGTYKIRIGTWSECCLEF